ncbi:hypothetical protein GVAV_002062 [Gurleya vavrai]
MLLPEEIKPYNYSYYPCRLDGLSELQEIITTSPIITMPHCIQLIYRSPTDLLLYERVIKENNTKKSNDKENRTEESFVKENKIDEENIKNGEIFENKTNENNIIENKIQENKTNENNNSENKNLENKNNENNISENKNVEIKSKENKTKDDKKFEGLLTICNLKSDDKPLTKKIIVDASKFELKTAVEYFLSSPALPHVLLNDKNILICLSRLEDDICYFYGLFSLESDDIEFYKNILRNPLLILNEYTVLYDDNNEEPKEENIKSVDNRQNEVVFEINETKNRFNTSKQSKSDKFLQKLQEKIKKAYKEEKNDEKKKDEKKSEENKSEEKKSEEKKNEEKINLDTKKDIKSSKSIKNIDIDIDEVSNEIEMKNIDDNDYNNENIKAIDEKFEKVCEDTNENSEGLINQLSTAIKEENLIIKNIDQNEKEKNQIFYGKLNEKKLYIKKEKLNFHVTIENLPHLFNFLSLVVVKMYVNKQDFVEIRSELDLCIIRKNDDFTFLLFDQVCIDDLKMFSEITKLKKFVKDNLDAYKKIINKK